MGILSLFNKKANTNIQIRDEFEKYRVPINPSYIEYNKICAEYYEGTAEIETMWSVITNLGLYNSNESEVLIDKCIKNIKDLDKMVAFGKTIDKNYTGVQNAPAYIRLAMLYEKRGDYDPGISVCIEGIKKGCVEDNSKGKMYGRLARLIKKAGIEPTQEMINMISMK